MTPMPGMIPHLLNPGTTRSQNTRYGSGSEVTTQATDLSLIEISQYSCTGEKTGRCPDR